MRRWASGQLLEDSRANIVVAMKLLVLYDNWHRQLEWQLGLALDDAGETWHHDIAEGSGGSDEGAKGPPAAAVALLQKPAVKACTDAAAALAKSSADVADKLLCLLGRLSMGYVHCQPLKVSARGAIAFGGRPAGCPPGCPMLCSAALPYLHASLQCCMHQNPPARQQAAALKPCLPPSDHAGGGATVGQLQPHAAASAL